MVVGKGESAVKTWSRRCAAAVLLAVTFAVSAAPKTADFKRIEGHFSKGEYAEVLRELGPLVEAGNPAAMNVMGAMFEGGHGVTKDPRVAAQYYRRSAEQGDAGGQYSWGTMLLYGSGVAKDEGKAAEWYRKSADQGDVDGQRGLGGLLLTGIGVEKDEHLGVQWIRRAADRGDARAQGTMGQTYRFGYGVDEDHREAARWYRMAADQGNADALNSLGNLHEQGAGGMRQDYAEAARLYEAAARQGDSYGQLNLARMYREGLGVASDAVMAYGWINLAASAESPHPDAADERNAMAQYMPKSLIAEGQRLAREWKPGTSLGKSKLKPVDVAPLAAAWNVKVSKASAKPSDQLVGQYPVRPEAKPGLTSCNTRCVNADCYRTYGDGRKVHFQARQKWNPFNNQFDWDSGSC